MNESISEYPAAPKERERDSIRMHRVVFTTASGGIGSKRGARAGDGLLFSLFGDRLLFY